MMDLIHTLSIYRESLIPLYQEELGTDVSEHTRVAEFLRFIEEHEDALLRECLVGHLTASALVCNSDLTRVVLTLHGKLKQWLQLGGHADGDEELWNVALKETEEESGIKRKNVEVRSAIRSPTEKSLVPFDIDFHKIPEHNGVPEHIHYDFRYLLVSEQEELTISDESDDLRWFDLAEAEILCPSEAMRRQFRKMKLIRKIT